MGSLVTLANMWVLSLLPLGIAAIFWAYRKGGRDNLQPVPTLFLLEILQRESAASKKVRPPWRILLDLLVLLLLLLAAGGLIIGNNSERVLIIVDNSLSMASGEDASFTRAAEVTRKKLDSLGILSQVSLMTPCPIPIRWTRGWVRPGEAASILENLHPEFCTDKLEELISAEIPRSNATRVLIVTDRAQPFSPARPSEENRVAIEFAQTRSWDGTAINFALEGLNLQGDEVNVDVVRYLAAPSTIPREEVKLALSQGDERGNGWRVVSERILGEQASLSRQVTFRVPEDGKIFKLELDLGNSREDALEEDNTVFFVKGSSGNRMGLISPLSAAELGLSNLPGFVIEDIEDEEEASRRDFKGSALIYHRIWPATLPQTNVLLVLPSTESSLFTTEILPGAQKVTRWEVSHPITSYLNLPLLEAKNPRVIMPPPWLKPIVSTEKGALVAAGERDGFRTAYIGFEIFPYQGKDSPLISILTLNTLKWLGASSGRSGFRLVGENLSQELSSSEPRYLYTLASSVDRHLSSSPSTNERFTLTQPGIVERIDPQGEKEFIAVNFSSSEESGLFDRPELSIPLIARNDSINEESAQALDWYLVIAALAFVLIVWFLDLRMRFSLKSQIH